MLERFDHVVLAVPDLARAGQEFEAAGFDVYDRGDPPGVMENRLVRFSDGSFIELLTFHGPSTHRFRAPFELGPGWIDYSVASSDLSAVETALNGVLDDLPGRRSVSKANPAGQTWAIELLEPGLGFGSPALPFLTREITPLQWRIPGLPSDVSQPFGIDGIAGVTVASDEPEQTRQALAAIAGEPECMDADGRQVFRFGLPAGRWIDLLTGVPDGQEAERPGLCDVYLRASRPIDGAGTFVLCGAKIRLVA